MKSSSDHSDVGMDYRGGSSSTIGQEDSIPIFLRRLNDLHVRVGTRTRFLIELDDAIGVQVRWYHNNVEVYCDRYQYINEGGFFCLDIAPVTMEDEGLWVCTAQNYAGKTSTAAHLSLTVPKAFKKPIFVESLRAALTQRGIVSLECKVIGVPTPKLRWYKDDKEIKAGDIFALTANSDDDCLGVYTCEATNVMGTAVSTSKIQVTHERPDGKWNADSLIPYGPPPKFVKGLKDVTGKLGNMLFLECQVEVPPWPQSVGWYNDMGMVNDGQLYHLLSDGLGMYGVEIKSLRANHNTTWKCVATSSMGVKAVSSCLVTVTYPKNYRVPRFLESLRAIMTDEGLVSFECKVIGYPTPELSWYKDGSQLQPGDVYELTGSKSLGTYCCVAQNCMGEASSLAELTIEDIESQLNESEKLQLTSKTQPPRFSLGLKSTEANINETLVFTVKVVTESTPSITWYKDDEELFESSRYQFSTEGNKTFILNIIPLEIEDQAEWKCVAVNKYGQTVTSCFLKLNIPKNFKSPRFLEELRIAFSNEGSVNLECKVIGVPQPQLKWFKDGQELNPGDMHKIISGQSGTCCLGTYTCQAHNCMGTVSSSATLLTMEDKSTVKSGASDDYLSVGNPLVRNESLSTIPEERTSQMEKSYTIEEPADISFSFDGKEVTVSLYETPDLTHDEALQIIEMYADELSEHISEDNVVDLPSLRIIKESSISGPIMMEALVIDVPMGFCQQQTMSDTEFDGVSLTEDKTFENTEKNESLCENSLEYFSDHLSSSNSKKDVFFSASETSPKRQSINLENLKQRSEDDGHSSFHTPKLFMSNSDDQMLTQLNLNDNQHMPQMPQNIIEKLVRSESNNTEEEVSELLAEIENELPSPHKYNTNEILTQSDEDELYSSVLNEVQNKRVSTVPLSSEENEILKINPQSNVDEFLKYMKIILEGTMVKMHAHESFNYSGIPTVLESSIQALHSLAWKFIEETERANTLEIDKNTANNVSNLMTAINASLLALEQIDDSFGVSDNILNEIQSSVCFDLETLNNKELSAKEILDRLSDQIQTFTIVLNRQVARITEQRIISVIQNTISTTLLYIKNLQQNCSKMKCVNINSLGPLFSMVQPLETILDDITLNEDTSIDEIKPNLKLKQMLIPPISSIAFSLDNLSKELKNENPEDDFDLKNIYDRINDSANQFMVLASEGTENNNIAECFISFTKPINDLCCHIKKISRSTENIVSSDYGSDDKLLLDFETLFDELMMDIDTLINNVNVVRDSENNINPLGSLLEPLQDIKIGFFQVNQVLLSNQAGSNMSFEVMNCFEHLSHQFVQLNSCIVNQSIVEERNKELPFESSIKMMQNILFNDAIDDLGVNGILFGSVMKPLLQLQNLIVSKMASVESDLSFSEHTDATGGASQSLSLSLSNNGQTIFDKVNNDHINLDLANPSLIDKVDKENENYNLLRETSLKVSENFIPVEQNKRNDLDSKRGYECDIGTAFKYEEPNIIRSEDDHENSGFEVLFDETDLETSSDFIEDEYLDSEIYPTVDINSSKLPSNKGNIDSVMNENYACIPEHVLELFDHESKHDLNLNSSLDLFDELQETLTNISEMTIDATKEMNSLENNSLKMNDFSNNFTQYISDLDSESTKLLNKTLGVDQVNSLRRTICNESIKEELNSSESNMSINGEKILYPNVEETIDEPESLCEIKILNVDQNNKYSEINYKVDSLDSDKTTSNSTIITNIDTSVENNITQTQNILEEKEDNLSLKYGNELLDLFTTENSKTDSLFKSTDNSSNDLSFPQDSKIAQQPDIECVNVFSDNDIIKNQFVCTSNDDNIENVQHQTDIFDSLKSYSNIIDVKPDNLDIISPNDTILIANTEHYLDFNNEAHKLHEQTKHSLLEINDPIEKNSAQIIQIGIENQDDVEINKQHLYNDGHQTGSDDMIGTVIKDEIDVDKEKNLVLVKDVNPSLNEIITYNTDQLTLDLTKYNNEIDAQIEVFTDNINSSQKIDSNEVVDNNLASEYITEQNDLNANNHTDDKLDAKTQNCFNANTIQPPIIESVKSNYKINYSSTSENAQNLTNDKDFQADDQTLHILNEAIKDENLFYSCNEFINTECLTNIDNNSLTIEQKNAQNTSDKILKSGEVQISDKINEKYLNLSDTDKSIVKTDTDNVLNSISTKNIIQENSINKLPSINDVSTVIPISEILDDLKSKNSDVLRPNVDSEIIDGQFKPINNNYKENVPKNKEIGKLLNSEIEEKVEMKLKPEGNVTFIKANNNMKDSLVESKNDTIHDLEPTSEEKYTDEIEYNKLETEFSENDDEMCVNKCNESTKDLKQAIDVEDSDGNKENVCQSVPTLHRETVEKVDIRIVPNEMNNALVNNEVVTAECMQLIEPYELDQNQVKTTYEDKNRENAKYEILITLENSNDNKRNSELSETKEDLKFSEIEVTDLNDERSLLEINNMNKDGIAISNDIPTNIVESNTDLISNDLIAVNTTQLLKKSDGDLENSEEKCENYLNNGIESQNVKFLETEISQEKDSDTQTNQKNWTKIQLDVNDGDIKQDSNILLAKYIEINHPKHTEEKSHFNYLETTDNYCENIKGQNLNTPELLEGNIIIKSEILNENEIVILDNELNKPLTESDKIQTTEVQKQFLSDEHFPKTNNLSNENVKSFSVEQEGPNLADQGNTEILNTKNTVNVESLELNLLKKNFKNSILVVEELSTNENNNEPNKTIILDDNKNNLIEEQCAVKNEERNNICNEENRIIDNTQEMRPIVMKIENLDQKHTETLLGDIENNEISVLQSTYNIDKFESSADRIKDEFKQSKTNEMGTISKNKFSNDQANENIEKLNNAENHLTELSKSECLSIESNAETEICDSEIVNEPTKSILNLNDNVNNVTQQKSSPKTDKQNDFNSYKGDEQDNLNIETKKELKLNKLEFESDNKTKQLIDVNIFENNANLENDIIPEEKITDLSIKEKKSTLTVKPNLHCVEQMAVDNTEFILLENANNLNPDYNINTETIRKCADVKYETNIAAIGNIVNDYESVIENTQNECNNNNNVEKLCITDVDEYRNEIMMRIVDQQVTPEKFSTNEEDSEKTFMKLMKTSNNLRMDSLNYENENSDQLSQNDEICQANKNTTNNELSELFYNDNINLKRDHKEEVNEKFQQLKDKTNQIEKILTTSTDTPDILKYTEDSHSKKPSLKENNHNDEGNNIKEKEDNIEVSINQTMKMDKNDIVKAASDKDECKSKNKSSEEDNIKKVENIDKHNMIKLDIFAKENCVEELIIQERNDEKSKNSEQIDKKSSSPDKSTKKCDNDHEINQQIKTKIETHFTDDKHTSKTSLSNELKNQCKKVKDEQDLEQNIKQIKKEMKDINSDNNKLNNLHQDKIENKEHSDIIINKSEVFIKETSFDDENNSKRPDNKIKKSLQRTDKKPSLSDESTTKIDEDHKTVEKTETNFNVDKTSSKNNLLNELQEINNKQDSVQNIEQTEFKEHNLDNKSKENFKEEKTETKESEEKRKTESEIFEKDKSFDENDNKKRGSKKSKKIQKPVEKSPSPDKLTEQKDKDRETNEQTEKKTESDITDDKSSLKTNLLNKVKNEPKEINDKQDSVKNIEQTEIKEQHLDNKNKENLKEEKTETKESEEKRKPESEIFEKDKSFEENDNKKRGSKKTKKIQSPSPDNLTNKKDKEQEISETTQKFVTDNISPIITNLSNESQEFNDEQNLEQKISQPEVGESKLDNYKINNLNHKKNDTKDTNEKSKTNLEIFDKDKSLDENDTKKQGSKKNKCLQKFDKKSPSPEKSTDIKDKKQETIEPTEKKTDTHSTDDKTSSKTNLSVEVKNKSQEIKDKRNTIQTEIEPKLDSNNIHNLKKEEIETNDIGEKCKTNLKILDQDESSDENDNKKRGSKKNNCFQKTDKKSQLPDKSTHKKDKDSTKENTEILTTDNKISSKTNSLNEIKNDSLEIKDVQNLDHNINQTEVKDSTADGTNNLEQDKIEANETNQKSKFESEIFDKDKSVGDNDNKKRGSRKKKSLQETDIKLLSQNKPQKGNDKSSFDSQLLDQLQGDLQDANKDDSYEKLNTDVIKVCSGEGNIIHKKENELEISNNVEYETVNDKQNIEKSKIKNDSSLQNKKLSSPKTETLVDDKSTVRENKTISEEPETQIKLISQIEPGLGSKFVAGVEKSKNEIVKQKYSKWDKSTEVQAESSDGIVHLDNNKDVFQSARNTDRTHHNKSFHKTELRSGIKSNAPAEYDYWSTDESCDDAEKYETTKEDAKILRSRDRYEYVRETEKSVLTTYENRAVKREKPRERGISNSGFTGRGMERRWIDKPEEENRRTLQPRVVIETTRDTSVERQSLTRRRDCRDIGPISSRRYLDVTDAYPRTTAPLVYRSLTPERTCAADSARYTPSIDREIGRNYSSRSLSPYPSDSMDSVYTRNRSLAPVYRCPSATTLKCYSRPDDDLSSYSRYGMSRRRGSDSFLHDSSTRASFAYYSSWRFSSCSSSSDRWLAEDMNRTKETFKRLYFCVRLIDQTVSSGTRVKLWCCVIGYPEPHVQWYREGQKLNSFSYNSSTRYRSTYANGLAQLIVDDAQSCDSGEYACVAANGRDRTSTTGFLTVYTSPSAFGAAARRPFREPPQSPASPDRRLYLWTGGDDPWRRDAVRKFDRGAAGSGLPRFATGIVADDVATCGGTIAFHVRVHGSPSPNVTWMRESRSLPRLSSKYVYLDEGGLHTLLVKDSTLQDGGTYVCRACNLYGTADTEKSVRVVSLQDYSEHRGVKPAIIVSRPNDRLNVAVGEDIVVTLRVAGEPKPKVIWMRGTRDVTFHDRSLKETVNDYVKLSIKKAQLSDAGTYFIIAKNVYGSDRAFVTVGVSDRIRTSSNTSR